MLISKMDLSDLNVISNILISDFDDFWNYNVFKEELLNNNSYYYKVVKNNEIVGFAGIWICIDEANIMNIVTKKNYRNNGIATLLLKHLINLANSLNLKSITLEVNENNLTAINLYKKLGFITLGTRKKYYNNEKNALIMTKTLIEN